MSKNKDFPIVADFVRQIEKSDLTHRQVDLGWFSISHVFIKDKIERRKSYGKWFKIKSGKFKYKLRIKGIYYTKWKREKIEELNGFFSKHNIEIRYN